MRTSTSSLVAGAILGLGALAAALVAGPLSPPAGPVAPTHKTLTQVEPRVEINSTNTPGDANSLFRITQPGSYYLSGNVTGAVGRSGIEIAASNVTVDLNGFALTGVAGATIAVVDDIAATGVRVHNGRIAAWPGGGVVLGGSRDCIIEDLTLNSIGATYGIRVVFNSIIRNCTIDNEPPPATAPIAGISAACCTLIKDCHVQCSGVGIQTGDVCTIQSCVLNNIGSHGIVVSAGPTQIFDCTVGFTGGDGIVVQNRASVFNSSVVGSAIAGSAAIRVNGFDCRVEGNHVVNSSIGIRAQSSGNVFLRNVASGNSTNFDIAAGNSGLFLLAATGAAFTGNSGGVALGGTDPNANYAY